MRWWDEDIKMSFQITKHKAEAIKLWTKHRNCSFIQWENWDFICKIRSEWQRNDGDGSLLFVVFFLVVCGTSNSGHLSFCKRPLKCENVVFVISFLSQGGVKFLWRWRRRSGWLPPQPRWNINLAFYRLYGYRIDNLTPSHSVYLRTSYAVISLKTQFTFLLYHKQKYFQNMV